jgi:hypothetical protein
MSVLTCISHTPSSGAWDIYCVLRSIVRLKTYRVSYYLGLWIVNITLTLSPNNTTNSTDSAIAVTTVKDCLTTCDWHSTHGTDIPWKLDSHILQGISSYFKSPMVERLSPKLRSQVRSCTQIHETGCLQLSWSSLTSCIASISLVHSPSPRYNLKAL